MGTGALRHVSPPAPAAVPAVRLQSGRAPAIEARHDSRCHAQGAATLPDVKPADA